MVELFCFDTIKWLFYLGISLLDSHSCTQLPIHLVFIQFVQLVWRIRWIHSKWGMIKLKISTFSLWILILIHTIGILHQFVIIIQQDEAQNDSWELWNSFRLLCEHHSQLSVALDILWVHRILWFLIFSRLTFKYICNSSVIYINQVLITFRFFSGKMVWRAC